MMSYDWVLISGKYRSIQGDPWYVLYCGTPYLSRDTAEKNRVLSISGHLILDPINRKHTDYSRQNSIPPEPPKFGQRTVKKMWIKKLLKAMGDYIPGVSLIRRLVTTIKYAFYPELRKSDTEGRYWKLVQLPTSPEARRQIAIDSALAQLPYDMDWSRVDTAEKIHRNPHVSEEQKQDTDYVLADIKYLKAFLSAAKKEKEKASENDLFKNIHITNQGMLVDPKTGLTAMLIKNKLNKGMTLVFGGTTSGVRTKAYKENDGEVRVQYFNPFKAQVLADIKNLFGMSRPKIYMQAAEIAIQLKKELGNSLNICGHSLGGGLAIFACAKADLKGQAFSTAALGKKTLAQLTQKEKLRAKEQVDNYLIAGDILNNSWTYDPFKKLFAPTIIGNRVIIVPDHPIGIVKRHSYSHATLMAYFASHAASSDPEQSLKI